MRVRATKLATLSRHTQTTFAAGDLTAPIRTGASAARGAPRSRWARLWERLRRRLRPKHAAAPVPVVEGHEGTLVEFLGWEGDGEARRVLYNPFPKSADACVDYEKPLVLLLDSEHVGDAQRLWFTSPVVMVYSDRDGLPVRVETRSSAYSIQWLDKPELPEN